MERVSGMSLDVELSMGPLPADRAAPIVAQLARTLSLVHGDGVVHGDVKPGNVLLGPGDQVTLTDFGVASPTRTRHRDVAHGTPPYLSPEQVRGRRVTPATDVYALGLVLLECLTGVRAFPGTPEVSAMARLEGGPLVPRSVPSNLAALVRDMTALDPVRRPTADQVAARLHARHAGTETALLTAGVPTQPVSTESKPWWLLVGTSLVAVTAVLAMTGPRHTGYQGQVPAPAPAAPTAAARAPSPHVARTITPSPHKAAPVAVAPAPKPVKGHSHRKHH
jgi:serine/threonine protein kinase